MWGRGVRRMGFLLIKPCVRIWDRMERKGVSQSVLDN